MLAPQGLEMAAGGTGLASPPQVGARWPLESVSYPVRGSRQNELGLPPAGAEALGRLFPSARDAGGGPPCSQAPQRGGMVSA